MHSLARGARSARTWFVLVRLLGVSGGLAWSVPFSAQEPALGRAGLLGPALRPPDEGSGARTVPAGGRATKLPPQRRERSTRLVRARAGFRLPVPCQRERLLLSAGTSAPVILNEVKDLAPAAEEARTALPRRSRRVLRCAQDDMGGGWSLCSSPAGTRRPTNESARTLNERSEPSSISRSSRRTRARSCVRTVPPGPSA